MSFFVFVFSRKLGAVDRMALLLLVVYSWFLASFDLPLRFDHPRDCLTVIVCLYPIGVMAMVDFLRRRWLTCLAWNLIVFATITATVHNYRFRHESMGYWTIILE
jgi:hypothetical protein